MPTILSNVQAVFPFIRYLKILQSLHVNFTIDCILPLCPEHIQVGALILTASRKQTPRFKYEFCYSCAATSWASDETLRFCYQGWKERLHPCSRAAVSKLSPLPCLSLAEFQAGPSATPRAQDYSCPREVLHVRQGVGHSNMCLTWWFNCADSLRAQARVSCSNRREEGYIQTQWEWWGWGCRA